MLPFTVFVCQLLAAQYVLGFNLDVKNAIILEGRTGSYFGFSVALVNNTSGAWLLSGAPLDNLRQRSEDGAAGALYKCPIIPVQGERECRKVPLSQTGGGPAGILNIGLAVDMQPIIKDKVVYCGYQIDPRSGHPSNATINGMCYELLQDLDYRRSSRIAPQSLGRGEIGKEDGQFLDTDNSDRIFYFPIHNSEGNTMLIGTPAAQNGRGAVVLYRGSRRLKRKVFPERGGFAGYSVSSGRLFRDPRLYYVVGAPGTDDKGKVYILGDGLNVIMEIPGEMDGGYFGAAISVVDVNGDGLDDVIIGAPLYSQRKEEGAVYVYLNRNEEPLQKMDTLLVGSLSPGAKFGSAIQNLGDMNRDSFEDFAIGAPYEDNGKGAIYIYNGHSEGIGLGGKYSQRIAAKDLPGGMDLQSFGMSFSRASDVDGNSYGDLAVGAPRSDAAVVIRGRPVADLQPRFRVSPMVIDPAVKTCRHKDERATCLRVEVCFVFRGYSLPASLDVQFSLHADTLKGGSRVQLLTDEGLYSGRNGSIRVARRRTACQKYNAVVLPQAMDDIFTPVQFGLNFDLPEGSPSDDVSKPVEPVLTAFLEKSASSQVQFKKNCGADNVCLSDLVLTARLAYPEGNPFLIVGAHESLRLEMNVLNSGEAAYMSTVIITYTDNVEFLSDPRSQVRCQASTGDFIEIYNRTTESKNKKQVMCEVGNPLGANADRTFTVIFDARRLSPKSSPVEFITYARTASNDTNMANNVMISKAVVRFQADIRLTGASIPEQLSLVRGSPDPKSNGKEITHAYEILNVGTTVLSRASVMITIPVGNLTADQVVLDRVEADVSDSGKAKCKVLSRGQNRSKEEITTHMPDMDTMLSDQQSSRRCSDGSCHIVKCTVKDLDSQQAVLFNSMMRLMPNAVDDIDGREIQVSTMAEVVVPANTIITAGATKQYSVMTKATVEEYVEPETTPEHEPVPEVTSEPEAESEVEPGPKAEPETGSAAEGSEVAEPTSGSTRTIIPLLVILSVIAEILL